jgi:hypothetical protein
MTDKIHESTGGAQSSDRGRTGPECLAHFSDIIWNTTNAKRQF